MVAFFSSRTSAVGLKSAVGFQWRFIQRCPFAFEKQQLDTGIIPEPLVNHHARFDLMHKLCFQSAICVEPQVWWDSYINKGWMAFWKKGKKAKLDWILVYCSAVSFSFQDKLDKVHCRNFGVTVSPSCLQCRLSRALDHCLGLNSMDCLRKGRAGHPLCFFSVSWHASQLYLTHFNSPAEFLHCRC